MVLRNTITFSLILILLSCGKSVKVPANSAANGMVVAEEKLAAEIGRDILKNGGNAFDAAVAVGFALAVTYPEAGNIGGGGYMIAHLENGENIALDFRETAPGKSFRDMYVQKDGTVNRDKILYGALAAGVPGTVDGLIHIHQKYGTLALATLLKPAIDLAENGLTVSAAFADRLKKYDSIFCRFKSTRQIFTRDGKSLEKGDTLKQKDLAGTLRLIAQHGRDGFYDGTVAKSIINTMEKYNGNISYDDLKNYSAVERTPLITPFKQYTIVTMPPSSSGGIIISQMVKMLGKLPLKKNDYQTLTYAHYLTEGFKRCYADRAEYLGDPYFVKIPLEYLISPIYANIRLREINPALASVANQIKPGLQLGKEKRETTHFNIVDKNGNAVAVTYTINGWFGSGLIVGGAGFFLNNEMDDFSAKPGIANSYGLIGSEANAIMPGKRMLSSQSPTLILENEEVVVALGAPGGSRIPSSVLQVAMNILVFNMDAQTAVSVPRLHHQWLPDTLYYEKGYFSPEIFDQMQQMRHILKETKGPIGRVELIYKDRKTGLLHGGLDPRAKRGGIAGF